MGSSPALAGLAEISPPPPFPHIYPTHHHRAASVTVWALYILITKFNP